MLPFPAGCGVCRGCDKPCAECLCKNISKTHVSIPIEIIETLKERANYVPAKDVLEPLEIYLDDLKEGTNVYDEWKAYMDSFDSLGKR